MDPRVISAKLPSPARRAPGVYVELSDLIALQHKARGFSFLPRQPIHSLLTGSHASRMRGRGLNFEEIRRYLPGDDVRNIDWRVTARTQKPHTRVFTEERDRPALLLVDQRLSMFFGTQRDMKSVTAAEVAALGAWRVFGVGDRIGALVFDDGQVHELRPHRSRNQVMRILQTIVERNHALGVDAGIDPGPLLLNRALEQARRLAGHDFLIGVISDFDGADEDTERHLLHLARHNDVIAIPIYDPSATTLPRSGRLVVSAGELQIELNVGDAASRQRVLDRADARLKRVMSWQSELGVAVLPLSTGEDPAEQVRRLLGSLPRARRG